MEKALKGIRVVEFSWAAAGPLIGKALADHGAEVIRVESKRRIGLDRIAGPYKDDVIGIERSGTYHSYNENKYGISLDLKKQKAVEIAKRIICLSDVVIENYRPGVMAKLGLGYDDLSKMKPDLIWTSVSILGQTGLYPSLAGLGVQLTGLVGLFHLTGWPDREPALPPGTPTDLITPLFGAVAVIAALERRRETGEGQYLDLAQYEASIHFLAPLVLDYVTNGRIANREGNRSAFGAPHGAYPCRGDDRWCVIAVFSDQEWTNFCGVIGNPGWTKDLRFATLQSRKENEDELDRLVAEWTSSRSAEFVMTRMQEAGVRAGVVKTSRDLQEDPQLEHRHLFWTLQHREIGDVIYQGPAFQMSRTPAQLETPAPCLGQHNEYVLTKILGMSPQEIVTLQEEGVFE